MTARGLVLHILKRFDSGKSNLDRIVDKALSTAKLDHRDKRFVFEMVYGIVRYRITLDYMIDRLLSNDGLRESLELRRILQLGLYQVLYLDRIPNHAAVNESVNLAKESREAKVFAGVVNAVLRKVIADRHAVKMPDESTDIAERLSVEYSHPKWMTERWLKNLGLANTRKLLAFNNERPDIYVRKKLKGLSKQQFESDMRAEGESVPCGYLNLFYRLKKNILPENIDLIELGYCTVQAVSSGWAVALLDAMRGEKIYDVCSAPGGKTTLISELVGETGSVYASDERWQRILLTADAVRRMRLLNVRLLAADGRIPPIKGSFDKVLLDAPCSSTGVMHRHPDARLTRKPGDIAELAALQGAMLDSAASLVKPGGILVYSTCSLEPEENGEQVRAFLQKHPEYSLDRCPESLPQTFIDADGFLTITPFEHGLDGMFGARLKRSR